MFQEEESLRRVSDEEIYTEGQKRVRPDRPIWLYSINIIKEQRKRRRMRLYGEKQRQREPEPECIGKSHIRYKNIF